MKQWFLLAGAITTEVAATLSLKAALNHPSWYIVVAAGYIGAFVFLTFCLREGMQIGVAYGIWGASGVVLAAVLSAAIFGEPLTAVMGLGMVLIISGVLTRRTRLPESSANRSPGSRSQLMRWIFLAGAILSEVVATMSLRASDGGRVKKWFIGVIAGYLVAFVALSLALADGMALGVAYGIWAASGVALTAILARVIFHEPLTRTMALGILFIAVGVLTVEIGANLAN